MKFHKCIEYPEYSYTNNGEFWHNNPAYRVIPKLKNSKYVLIFNDSGILYEINELELFMKLYFGNSLDLPVIYKDDNPRNLSSENLYYDIPFEKIAQFESPYTTVVNLGGQLFKRIKNFPNYFISEYGMVYGIWWKKIMILNQDKDGYYFIRLAYGNSKKKNLRISRLVYETFIGEIPKGYVIDHYDGNILYNHAENLTAMHPDDNTLKGHTFDMRRDSISKEVVIEICKNIQNGLSLEQIFAIKNIGENFPSLQSFTNFCLGLVRGYYFREISKDYDLRNFHYYGNGLRKYLPSQIKDVCEMIQAGIPKGIISKKLGIPMSSIKNVYNRNSWTEISNKYSF